MEFDTVNLTKKNYLQKKKKYDHTIVKDHDLQIRLSASEDVCYRHPLAAESFAQSLNSAASFAPHSPEHEINVAMAEADDSYDSIMQIRQELREAYEELMHSSSTST